MSQIKEEAEFDFNVVPFDLGTVPQSEIEALYFAKCDDLGITPKPEQKLKFI